MQVVTNFVALLGLVIGIRSLKPLTSNNWRQDRGNSSSKRYIKVVAVKKFVVGPWVRLNLSFRGTPWPSLAAGLTRTFTAQN